MSDVDLKFKRVAVIGVGTMGSQIAEMLSRIGNYEVNISDSDSDLVDKGCHLIEENLEHFYVAKGKMSPEEKNKVLKRIKKCRDMDEAASNVDFIIEAVFENMDLKKDVFQRLDKSAPPGTILATNTSMQNISEIAASTARPELVVGMHFFNPVAVMKLVEVIRGVRTSDRTIETACALARKLNKEPVVCRDSSYGFLANRAYNAILNETLQMVWERVASPADIDKALRLGYNFPMGPLELFDFTGAWAHLAAVEPESVKALGPEKGSLHPLLKKMVHAGYVGGKGQKGIYDFWNDVLSK